MCNIYYIMKQNLTEELKKIHNLLYGKKMINESDAFSNILKSIGIEDEEPVIDIPMKADYVSPDVKDFYDTLEKTATGGGLTQQEKGEYTYQKSVEALQIGLDLLGYKLPKYGVDGKFGPETTKAVNDFTSENVIDPVFVNLMTQDSDDSDEELTESMVELGSYEKTLANVDYKSPGSDITNDKLPQSLLDDLQKAAEAMNATVTITRAKSNHKKMTSSGHISRHWRQQAVDIPLINGKSALSTEGKKLFDQFVDSLQKMGYTRNSEKGNPKSVLWQMKKHYDHIHVSNQTDSSSTVELPKTETGKPMVSEPKKDLKLVTATPDMIRNLISKLKLKGIDDDDLKPYLDSPKKSLKPKDKESSLKSDTKAKTTTDDEYVIIKSDNYSGKRVHVLFGGMHTNPSYSSHGASVSNMKSYIPIMQQFSQNAIIVITHHMNSLDNVKKYVKDKFNMDVTSIAGFSQGGKETWKHATDSSLSLVGLIDPSTYDIDKTLGPNTYMVCDPTNWGGEDFEISVRKRLKWYCEHKNDSKYVGHIECVDIGHNLKSSGIVKYFYDKYSNKL